MSKLDFKDIKDKEVKNFLQIFKKSSDKSKCLKELIMRSKSPQYRRELLDMILCGEIPSSSTIYQMRKKISAVSVAMITLYRYSCDIISYDDIWNMYNEIITLENDFPFLDLVWEKDLIMDELL